MDKLHLFVRFPIINKYNEEAVMDGCEFVVFFLMVAKHIIVLTHPFGP